MANKSGRVYKLTIEIDSPSSLKPKAIEITNPLTIEFDIDRNTSSTLNSGVFRIYNLSETNRGLIFQNLYSSVDAQGRRRKVTMQADYQSRGDVLKTEGNLATIFSGDLLQAYSFRQGSDVITYISAQDGSFATRNSLTSITFSAGELIKDGLKKIVADLKGIKIGAIGETLGTYKTSASFNNNTFYVLNQNFKDEFFIDLGKFNKLAPNEFIKSIGFGIPSITSSSGLLGTPLRQGTNIVVDMLFEPKLNVAQLVKISSQINKQFDGQYKIIGIKHSGIISDAVNGDCRTTLQLFAGDKLTGGFVEVSQ